MMPRVLSKDRIPTTTIIDLTIDTDGADDRPLAYSLPSEDGHSTYSSPLWPSLTLEPTGQSAEPPAKRQKRVVPVEDASAGLFEECLRKQVFPHVDRACHALGSTYDATKIGEEISRRIIDDEFKRQFDLGNGRISAQYEAAIVARITPVVHELTGDPAYHLSRKVIPIIEIESDDDPEITEVTLREDEEDDLSYEHDFLPDIRPDTVHQTPPRKRPKKAHATPQELRAKAVAAHWQSGRSLDSSGGQKRVAKAGAHPWFGLNRRPYLSGAARDQYSRGGVNRSYKRIARSEVGLPWVFHVDFTSDEVRYLQLLGRALYGSQPSKSRSSLQDLRHMLKKSRPLVQRIADLHGEVLLGKANVEESLVPPRSMRTRAKSDIDAFLVDLLRHQTAVRPRMYTINYEKYDKPVDFGGANRMSTSIFSREIFGERGFGFTRRYENFRQNFRAYREDQLSPRIEWTNCAGDIATVSWVSRDQFICGTTTHSDRHNQQYNKPGNLLLGSLRGTLQAYPDHRVERPSVPKGDNALSSMRESQDPWLYTSVVSSDYEPQCDLAFTSSFDGTVKVWQMEGETMSLVGNWPHEGRVNLVVASRHPHRLVATATDVLSNAVRVYEVAQGPDISGSYFHSYSCTRIHDEEYVPSEKWGYCPAAIRWGLASNVRHLLLIGYSPRSLSGDDSDIPQEKQNTGELCLWDTILRQQVKVNSAATQNVFEVEWHPLRDSFAAATSASGLEIEDNIRTQIRIFERSRDTGQYTVVKTLDCDAVDINEISIRPNSFAYSYVTASCTDGKVYVWDTASRDEPICVLKHGEPLEELLGEREQEDVGVKFTAWGSTTDRLYTGSSDGVVKVWNVRHRGCEFVRNLVEVPGPITFGAFSPDHTKLVIGDGSGRVCLLTLEDHEPSEADRSSAPSTHASSFVNLSFTGGQRTVRRPRPFIPHPEVPPPGTHDASGYQEGQERAKEFLERGELVIHPDPRIGAVKGPNYASSGLFRREFHADEDPEASLLATFESWQQENIPIRGPRRARRQRVVEQSAASAQLHAENLDRDLDIDALDLQSKLNLEADRAQLAMEDADYDEVASGDYTWDQDVDLDEPDVGL